MYSSKDIGWLFPKLTVCLSLASKRLKLRDAECLISKIQTMLSNNRTLTDAPCTASADSVCWLLDSLDLWNAVLYRGGLGLREEKPGSLTCQTFDMSMKREQLIDHEGILEAACGFYLLFCQHHCVHRLVIGNEYPLRSEWYWHPVLALSLEVSKELRSVELVSLPDEQGKCCVLKAAAGLARLQRLKCSTRLTSESSLYQMLQPCGHRLTELVLVFGKAELTEGSVFGYLELCSSLDTLRIDGIEVRDPGSLFRFMAHNKSVSYFSLKLLHQDMSYIERGIASVLRKNSSLKQLELSLYNASVSLIAESLESNATLEVISMEGFYVTDILPLVRMLKTNRTLRKLKLASVRSSKDSASLVEAIRVNETLLELGIWGSNTLAQGLVDALRDNSTLTSLHFGQVSASRNQGRLKKVALEPWALGRLVTSWDGGCCVDLAKALRSGATMSSVSLFYTNSHSDWTFHGLGEVFDTLCFNQTLKSLSLMSTSDFLPRSIARKVCRALASNKTLESLSLSINDCGDVAAMKLICKGLSQNSHIRILLIAVSVTHPTVLRYMRALLGKNQSLMSLELRVRAEGDTEGNVPKWLLKECTTECVLLSEAMARNEHLLEIHVEVKYGSFVYTPDMALTVLRNLSSVSRAVRYVLTPSTDKQAAETFQKYQWSPVLFQRLKEAKAMSDEEAAFSLRSAASFIACHFFVITAIVKWALQCKQSTAGALQIADLHETCLLKIVSYLKVNDVQT